MTEAEAVAEFREASAAVRRAFGARDDARVDQILADTRMSQATVNLSDAQARLLAADVALQAARAEPPTPADIDVTQSQFFGKFHNVVDGSGNAVHRAPHYIEGTDEAF
jgi:outer membrane protein TolC